jgi:hypothetical protein
MVLAPLRALESMRFFDIDGALAFAYWARLPLPSAFPCFELNATPAADHRPRSHVSLLPSYLKRL